MAAENRKDRGLSSEVSIPSGLNRIKTRLAPSGLKPDESAVTVPKPPPPFNNRKPKSIAPRSEYGKTTSKQGFDFSYDHFETCLHRKTN
ncbi:hypothetical protein F2Q69_00058629 [Brassica cretica]|uniref:Uncharacterized protein n=1 Tax=Brassica cretica TaxID=69181 RepID=A0A8S9RCY8_BRACR|nr:hypothetical protein F2Q69_00058629 [Brassica cretica]